jgi:hypothetical protein
MHDIKKRFRQIVLTRHDALPLDKFGLAQYKEGGETWLTPSEIFHPWYARAVARYVIENIQVM